MGISKGKALCFVIDTTGSMSDDIAAVRTVTSQIINSEVGTEDEPSLYILVPFNDPGRILMPQNRIVTCLSEGGAFSLHLLLKNIYINISNEGQTESCNQYIFRSKLNSVQEFFSWL